jgi:predicted HTH domain antitoxin
METISARLDTDTLNLFGKVMQQNRSETLRELVNSGKKHKAVELYNMKKVSLGLGAQLAGVGLSEFIDLLQEHNVDLNITKNDVQQALATARKIF